MCVFRVNTPLESPVKTKSIMYGTQRIYNEIVMCTLRRRYKQHDICRCIIFENLFGSFRNRFVYSGKEILMSNTFILRKRYGTYDFILSGVEFAPL